MKQLTLKKKELVGKEFKWVSPRTSGETFGIIDKIVNDNTFPKIVSTKNNVYYLTDCEIKINEKFEKVILEKNVGDIKINSE